MSNSPLVNYTKISPNSSNPRNKPITKITIHHVAGNLTVEQIGNVFATKERKASSNYGVDNYGRVGMYVEEKNRAWTSSNSDNDNQAVTIEVANITGAPDWKVSDVALNKTIDLCVDICKRNNIKRLNFTGDKTGNLTMHKWFAATACPGPYLESKFPYIANEVNKRLNTGAEKPSTDVLYRVQTGAFKNKSNADALLAKVKAAGFDTYMIQADGLYKVQVGAFSVKSNADAMAKKLKSKGFDVYITTKGGSAVSSSPASKKTLKVGSKVKITGSKYATGQTIPGWVKSKTYTVQQIAGDKALIKEIVSWVFTKDLMLI
jgi:N-acetyl-anhydromuramyl-L-alanine amidase AmpD